MDVLEEHAVSISKAENSLFHLEDGGSMFI
jgi:hypothetical protein